jgi:hypothetical protein
MIKRLSMARYTRCGFAWGIGALSVLLVQQPTRLLAHHATAAEFDNTKPIKFVGTVKSVDWLNPHIYVNIEARDPAGKPTVYSVEGGAPNTLYRNGWRKDTLKIGEEVTVSGSRARKEDSHRVGSATITTKDGRNVLGLRDRNPQAPQ